MIPWLDRLSKHKWLAILWSAIIFSLMVMPKSSIPSQGLFGIPHLDKVVHMILFGVFVWTWYHSFPIQPRRRSIRLYFIVAALYGIIMEWVQVQFTDRSFDLLDILADILGAGIIAALLAWDKK